MLLQQLTPHRRICLQDIVELLEYMEFVRLLVFPTIIIVFISISTKKIFVIFLTLRMLNVYLSVNSAP